MTTARRGSGWTTALTVVGGTAGALGVLYYVQRKKIASNVAEALTLPSGGRVALRLTGYYPTTASMTEAEKRMEGGPLGAAAWPRGKPVYDPATGKRVVLHTLEEHLADPVAHPFVALSGDPDVWPFGQRLLIPEVSARAVFRIVDTGGHFTGAGKVFRIIGREPIDVRVNSPATKIPTTVDAQIVSGDNWQGGAAVAMSKLGHPVVGGGPVVEGFTVDDHEALARAVASLPTTFDRAAREAVAWTCRNRAEILGVAVADILAPNGECGPAGGGRFCSTRVKATAADREVADRVLTSPVDSDPTEGAVDFWVPQQQDALRTLGDLHRRAVARGDDRSVSALDPYASYTASADDVRAWQRAVGLRPVKSVGPAEFLRCGDGS